MQCKNETLPVYILNDMCTWVFDELHIDCGYVWCITCTENQRYVKQACPSILFLSCHFHQKCCYVLPFPQPPVPCLIIFTINTLVHLSTLSWNLLLCSLLLHQTELASIDSYCAVVYSGEWFFVLVAVEVFGWMHSFLILAHFELWTPFTKSNA